MKDKRRVKVLIRRLAGSRGCITGYVRSFDKHLNMLLADCDEEYVPIRALAKRRDVSGVFDYTESQSKKRRVVFRRFLAQVMVRGDNIILVCRSDSDDANVGKKREA